MGKDDYKTVLKRDKKRIVMFVLLFALLGYSIFTTKRLVQIGAQYVRLENEMEVIGCIDSPEKRSDVVIENATPTAQRGVGKPSTSNSNSTSLRSGVVGRTERSYFDSTTTEKSHTESTHTQNTNKVTKSSQNKATPQSKNNTHYNRKSELIKALD